MILLSLTLRKTISFPLIFSHDTSVSCAVNNIYVRLQLSSQLSIIVFESYNHRLIPTELYNIELAKYLDRSPYVTGTSVIGMKYKDGVILAADTGGHFFRFYFICINILYYTMVKDFCLDSS